MVGTWKLLNTSTTGTGTTTISSGTFTASDYLRIIIYYHGIGEANPQVRFNNDSSSSNYYNTYRVSNSSNSTGNTQSSKFISYSANGTPQGFMQIQVMNLDNEEKLVTASNCEKPDTNASSAPNYIQWVGKYTVKSGQVTEVSLTSNGSNFGSESYISVYGASDDVTSDEKTTLTNVPTGTQYRETDTRKIYRRAAAPTADFEDNFPSGSESSGWTIANGTNTTFGSGKMTHKNVRTTTNQSVAKSLGVTTTNNAWLLRFKVKRINSSGSQGRAFVEISDQNQATTSGSSSLSSLRVQLHDTNGVVIEQMHGGSGSGSASLTSTLSNDTDYWIQVIYTGTGATAQVFTDSSYSTPLSGTSTSTATSLTARTYQYFAIRNPDWSSDGHWKEYEFDDIEFYDGITSAPSASWKERGTA